MQRLDPEWPQSDQWGFMCYSGPSEEISTTILWLVGFFILAMKGRGTTSTYGKCHFEDSNPRRGKTSPDNASPHQRAK